MSVKQSTPEPGPIGVIPAAGRARRLGRLPCSKEILPVGIRPAQTSETGRPIRVAIDAALDAFRMADIHDIVIVLSPSKLDVPAYLGDGGLWGLRIEYAYIEDSPGSPFSIDQARSIVGERPVALAYPDIRFRPVDAIARLRRSIGETGADLTLALVPSDAGHKVDLVRFDKGGRITGLDIKPGRGQSGWTWISAVWGPRFTDFLGCQVARISGRGENWRLQERELHVGDVVHAACKAGLDARALRFPDGSAVDIGTAEDLARVWSVPE